MGLSVTDAYQQIKSLENSGRITLPETQDTVMVGTIDPAAGTFGWAVPTVVQTTSLPPGPGGKTNTIINVTVGVVSTKAVDLRLKFAVIPQPSRPVATARVAASAARVPIGAGIGVLGETNGGTTIAGFPTIASSADSIIVDAGLACSAVMQTQQVSPPVSTSSVTINIPGHQPINLSFFVLRPPAVALGAFTIPALPMTIVYAPPQGHLQKNTATYSDTTTLTRTISSSITSSSSTKSVQAYTASELVGKVASAIAAVVAVVGTGGAGAGGASVAGAFAELGAALFGGAKEANDSAADSAKQVASELSLVSGILGAVDSSTPSDGGTVTTGSDHSLTLTLTRMSQYGSENALGPGVGDRIIYMSNVKVVWMAVNGEVGIHILGFDGIGANAVKDLRQEEQSLAAGGPSTLGLDLNTIKSLLALDPLAATVRMVSVFGGPLIGPPRFVPASPAGRKGTGTSAGGDVFQASFDVASDDKQTTTNSHTTITDAKPGWVSVLFGADNVETTTTTTFTSSQSTDDKAEDKVVSTITLVSEGIDDPYDVKIFYDRTFRTYAIVNSNSSVLQGGVSVVGGVLTSMTTSI